MLALDHPTNMTAPHRTLARYASLNDEERRLLQIASSRLRPLIKTRERIDAHAVGISALTAGWVASIRDLADGRRQVLDFFGPGDLLGVLPRQKGVLTLALTPVQLIDLSEVAPDKPHCPNIAAAIVAYRSEQIARLTERLVSLGRRTAIERLAHLLLELDDRIGDRERQADGGWRFPLTQEMLGDALGLSVVHVNRTLQQLRREELVVLSKARLCLLDRRRLADLAQAPLK
jgi:CRP-like cAMP-binding protein